jgi:hypothetical protein
MGAPDVAEFLKRVLPWPGDGPGYINLHYTSPDQKSAHGLAGRPYRNLVDFMHGLDWAKSHPAYAKDIYFCLSRQRETGKVYHGRTYALRNHINTTALKAIWLDIDVKPPPKGYATLVEALQALKAFVEAATLPSVSALVGSGGGLHCYWISDRELAPDEWAAYAGGLRDLAVKHGLRCDLGVTIDCARVLRVPSVHPGITVSR